MGLLPHHFDFTQGMLEIGCDVEDIRMPGAFFPCVGSRQHQKLCVIASTQSFWHTSAGRREPGYGKLTPLAVHVPICYICVNGRCFPDVILTASSGHLPTC